MNSHPNNKLTRKQRGDLDIWVHENRDKLSKLSLYQIVQLALREHSFTITDHNMKTILGDREVDYVQIKQTKGKGQFIAVVRELQERVANLEKALVDANDNINEMWKLLDDKTNGHEAAKNMRA